MGTTSTEITGDQGPPRARHDERGLERRTLGDPERPTRTFAIKPAFASGSTRCDHGSISAAQSQEGPFSVDERRASTTQPSCCRSTLSVARWMRRTVRAPPGGSLVTGDAGGTGTHARRWRQSRRVARPAVQAKLTHAARHHVIATRPVPHQCHPPVPYSALRTHSAAAPPAAASSMMPGNPSRC